MRLKWKLLLTAALSSALTLVAVWCAGGWPKRCTDGNKILVDDLSSATAAGVVFKADR